MYIRRVKNDIAKHRVTFRTVLVCWTTPNQLKTVLMANGETHFYVKLQKKAFRGKRSRKTHKTHNRFSVQR